MNISLSKHSNFSVKIHVTSRFLYLSPQLESLVLAELVHVIINASQSKLQEKAKSSMRGPKSSSLLQLVVGKDRGM
jgi:hypothetical protein